MPNIAAYVEGSGTTYSVSVNLTVVSPSMPIPPDANSGISEVSIEIAMVK